ncbi:tRNA1(Val) (adenine(37)-N6)-methyltransferase [Algibacillus agarilyticus]|uniref:tRNA1(Val) (adenine(37)-N6)-methyltransferase n=1 Tax=Algibacillus agarilyticus TaxID=2234133 RepID=UPI000DD0DE30|nr:methyltransferase [Algibacillus agarilyticus]
MAFTFKQFHIADDQCAMKVGTDSIMLGSWSAINHTHQKILDIGTGSGLLAIMLAQKAQGNSQIVACEFDKSAAKQALENVKITPWVKQVEVINTPIQMLKQTHFDLIISNPPYFSSGQHFEPARQLARHTGELTWPVLLKEVSRRLNTAGCFECVIPADNVDSMIELASGQGLTLSAALFVKTKPTKLAKRVLLRFIKDAEPQHVLQEEVNIYTLGMEYSPEYKALCREYYLNF